MPAWVDRRGSGAQQLRRVHRSRARVLGRHKRKGERLELGLEEEAVALTKVFE